VTILRIATWNIFGGRGRGGGPADLDLTLATLRGLDADLVALQEVDRDQERSGRVDQARVLAEALGMEWRFAPTLFGPAGWDPAGRAPAWRAAEAGVADPGGAAYGIGLLSRRPLGRVETLMLPRATRDEPRVALVAEVATAAGPLAVAGTHLSVVPGANVGQLRFLQDRLVRRAPPRLLAGDLNLWLPLVRALSRPGWRPLVRGGTFPNRPPGRFGKSVQLDHVLASGSVWPRRSRIQAGPASDHRAVLVEVELGGGPPRALAGTSD
jgi:endonuclease/exonuclease/phosphatase family metal-dependent hydrolase